MAIGTLQEPVVKQKCGTVCQERISFHFAKTNAPMELPTFNRLMSQVM